LRKTAIPHYYFLICHRDKFANSGCIKYNQLFPKQHFSKWWSKMGSFSIPKSLTGWSFFKTNSQKSPHQPPPILGQTIDNCITCKSVLPEMSTDLSRLGGDAPAASLHSCSLSDDCSCWPLLCFIDRYTID